MQTVESGVQVGAAVGSERLTKGRFVDWLPAQNIQGWVMMIRSAVGYGVFGKVSF